MLDKDLNKVVKIENSFILNAQYRMTAKEQKILYYLVSHLDPKNEREFHTIEIPIFEIEDMLRENDAKYGSLHEEMERLCKSLSTKQITFPAGFTNRGRVIHGYINWFQSIIPIKKESGENIIQFTFSEHMTPFLLQLHHYVNIGVQEVVPMSNAHSIRMYSIFKCEADRLKNVKKEVILKYFLEELKAILGIADKYKNKLIDLKINVLDKIRDDINENAPSMNVDYSYIKTARKVTGVTFNVSEKQKAEKQLAPAKPKKEPKPKIDIKTYTPTEKELATLTRAKWQGYTILLNYGVFAGIAYKQIVPKIKGSEFDGYEDFFIEKAILHFEKNAVQNATNELKASTFVTWWTKNKVFEQGAIWSDILEKLVKHKKQLQNKKPLAFENRILAKGMTNAQFEAYIKKQVFI